MPSCRENFGSNNWQALEQKLLHENSNHSTIAAQQRQSNCCTDTANPMFKLSLCILVARRDCNGSGFSKRIFRLCFFFSIHTINMVASTQTCTLGPPGWACVHTATPGNPRPPPWGILHGASSFCGVPAFAASSMSG